MKFIRATRTSGAIVFINLEQITALQWEESQNLRYTAITLHNGREIDVQETPEELLQATKLTVVEL